jgi:hypothetical protein
MDADILQDLDDSTRIILLDAHTSATRSYFREYTERMRYYHPEVDSVILKRLYEKYMGWDGRTLPTHDLETGRRKL